MSIMYHTILVCVEITEAYQVLGNVETRKVYDQEIGSYFILRGSTKKETVRPVWRLLDDRIVNIDARNIKQVWYWGFVNIQCCVHIPFAQSSFIEHLQSW